MKILYHGSDHILRHPVYHGGKPYNDYGHGFYCTESPDLAKEWAVTKEARKAYLQSDRMKWRRGELYIFIRQVPCQDAKKQVLLHLFFYAI